ncbi:hypothetical protein IFR05_005077 [Cadophora sp. M221]|nr:hypothetical protein IFR05_005077 [Cadophora sp. M221]
MPKNLETQDPNTTEWAADSAYSGKTAQRDKDSTYQSVGATGKRHELPDPTADESPESQGGETSRSGANRTVSGWSNEFHNKNYYGRSGNRGATVKGKPKAKK